MSRRRSAFAGGVAALVWAALEPLDRRVFGSDYSDVAMLGKLVTRTRAWPLVGVAMHCANGVAFGLAFDEVRRRTNARPTRLAVGLALAENFALFPFGALVDAKHPARGERGVASFMSARGLAQATMRHALFGLVLGRTAQ